MRNLNMPVDWHVSSLLINFNNNGNGFFYISGHPISDIRRLVLIPSTKLSMCMLYALWFCFMCLGLPVLKFPDHWNDNNRMQVIWWFITSTESVVFKLEFWCLEQELLPASSQFLTHKSHRSIDQWTSLLIDQMWIVFHDASLTVT